MRHFALFTVLLLVFSGFLQAQEAKKDTAQSDTTKFWKTGGVTTINFSQVSLTNWAAGGESSYSLNGLVSLFANYKKDKLTWENSLDIGYGIIKQGEREVRKTDDKIDLMTKMGYNAGGEWYYMGMLNFKTQMDEGFKYDDEAGTKAKISDLLSPAYLLISLGMEYKPGDKFTANISPLTGKMTFVLNDELSEAGAFGVEPGEKARAEFGGYVKMAFKDEIWTNVTLSTKLDLFTNYLKNPQNIDVNWEVLLAMKVNKFLTANLSTQLIYDDDIAITDSEGNTGPRVQFKEVLGIGLSLKF